MDLGSCERSDHSRASLNLIVEPELYMLLRRKLRDRKPSLFNAFEIFDHTGTAGIESESAEARTWSCRTPTFRPLPKFWRLIPGFVRVPRSMGWAIFIIQTPPPELADMSMSTLH